LEAGFRVGFQLWFHPQNRLYPGCHPALGVQ
jgi:hypothetical protein